MNRSDDLRQQLRAAIDASPFKSDYKVAGALGLAKQTLGDMLTGKDRILRETLERALELLGFRLVLKRLEDDPEAVARRAFSYASKLYAKESRQYESFVGAVVWLCTGNTSRLTTWLRSMTVQHLHQPILSFEEAVFVAAPICFGQLTPKHQEVALHCSEGESFWDDVEVRRWKQDALTERKAASKKRMLEEV